MATGSVKWFSNPKGYGFIVPDDGGKDLFVHHSNIEMDGFRTLDEGQRVEFEVTEGRKGPEATKVRGADQGGGGGAPSGGEAPSSEGDAPAGGEEAPPAQ